MEAPERYLRFDPVGWWPDLFEGMAQHALHAFVESWTANWHDGWVPNRDHVALSLLACRGVIDEEELLRRALQLARQHRELWRNDASRSPWHRRRGDDGYTFRP